MADERVQQKPVEEKPTPDRVDDLRERPLAEPDAEQVRGGFVQGWPSKLSGPSLST